MRIGFINSWVPKTMLDFTGSHYKVYRSLQKKKERKKKQNIFSKVHFLLLMPSLNALWGISFIVKEQCI
jgi:hypothetical protein